MAIHLPDDLADSLEENYGECELGSGQCYHGPGPQCLKLGWKGILCPHWRPLVVKTWDELKEWLHAKGMLGMRQKNRGQRQQKEQQEDQGTEGQTPRSLPKMLEGSEGS